MLTIWKEWEKQRGEGRKEGVDEKKGWTQEVRKNEDRQEGENGIFFQTYWDSVFFLLDYEVFTTIDHVLGHKETLDKYAKDQVLQVTFSDCPMIKLGVKTKGITMTKTTKGKGKSKSLDIF